MFPRNENRNEGTIACFPGTKTGTRVHLPKPPFYETALLSSSGSRELSRILEVHVCKVPACELFMGGFEKQIHAAIAIGNETANAPHWLGLDITICPETITE